MAESPHRPAHPLDAPEVAAGGSACGSHGPMPSASSCAVPSRCIRCDEPLTTPLVCGNCRTVFPAANEYDHFARFGLPRTIALDEKDLERRYLMLSRGLHPDQFAVRGTEDKLLAEQLSAHVNDAFSVLKDRFRRAEYLLELEGGPQRAQEKRTPAGFLAEMLEVNEQIEEARGALDDSARKQMASLRAEITKRRDAFLAEVAQAFASLPAQGDLRRPGVLLKVRERLNACAYLEGLALQIREMLVS